MRIMRLLVMFDLPTKTKSNKDAYTKFRRFLEDDGYIREQNSIYSRNLLSRASAEAHAEQLRKNLPPAGHVVAMQFTEKQYVDREILVNTGTSGSGGNETPGTQLFLSFSHSSRYLLTVIRPFGEELKPAETQAVLLHDSQFVSPLRWRWKLLGCERAGFLEGNFPRG